MAESALVLPANELSSGMCASTKNPFVRSPRRVMADNLVWIRALATTDHDAVSAGIATHDSAVLL